MRMDNSVAFEHRQLDNAVNISGVKYVK